MGGFDEEFDNMSNFWLLRRYLQDVKPFGRLIYRKDRNNLTDKRSGQYKFKNLRIKVMDDMIGGFL